MQQRNSATCHIREATFSHIFLFRKFREKMFKVSVMFAVATLAGAANAAGELLCNGNADPADCKDLTALCGNTLISGNN